MAKLTQAQKKAWAIEHDPKNIARKKATKYGWSTMATQELLDFESLLDARIAETFRKTYHQEAQINRWVSMDRAELVAKKNLIQSILAGRTDVHLS